MAVCITCVRFVTSQALFTIEIVIVVTERACRSAMSKTALLKFAIPYTCSVNACMHMLFTGDAIAVVPST